MKKYILFSLLFCVAMNSHAYETWVTNGYKFAYTVSNGKATLTGDTKDYSYSGDLVIPAYVNGIPVTTIGGNTFNMIPELKDVIIENGIEEIGHAAFYADGTGPTSVTIPPSVTRITGSYVFRTMPKIYWTVSGADLTISSGAFAIFYGQINVTALAGVPKNMPKVGVTRYLENNPSFSCPRKHLTKWLNYYNNDYRFVTAIIDMPVIPMVQIIKVAKRANDPTILDVVYNVKSVRDKVKVRALAYLTGRKSFANVIRPVTFTTDSKAYVGDAIVPNVNHTLSWHVSADVSSSMSDIAFEVLAIDEAPLTLELTTIPETSTHKAITYSWNALTNEMLLNALYWYYANGESDLALENGTLKSNGVVLASGTSLSNAAKAAEYVFGKMGYTLLTGTELSYVNSVTNLRLSPSGARQYAVKYP